MLVSQSQMTPERGHRKQSAGQRMSSNTSRSNVRTGSVSKKIKQLFQQNSVVSQTRETSTSLNRSLKPNQFKKRAPQTGGLAVNAAKQFASPFMLGGTLKKKLKKSSRSPAKRSANQTLQNVRHPSIEISQVYTPKQEEVDEKFRDANIEIKESLKHFKNFNDVSDIGTLRSQFQNSGKTADSFMHLTQSQEFQDLIRQSQLLDQKVDQIKSASSRATINIKVKTSSPEQIRKSSTRKIKQVIADEVAAPQQEQILMSLLKDKIKVQKLEIEQLRSRIDLVRQNQLHEIQMVVSEKEQAHNLLRKRNEQELKLQSEILEKNSIIESLTKKLKESTQIILQINQKNQQLSKNYSVKITEKVKLKTEELKAKEAERIEKLNTAHRDKLKDLEEEIKLMTARVKEADNLKVLYKETKQRLQELQDSATKVNEQNEIITRQSESMTHFQTVNSQLQDQIKQLNGALSAKDTQVEVLTKQKEELISKSQKQVASAQEEFEKIIDSLKKQNLAQINSKNNEIQELMNRLSEQEITNETVNAQALANTEQELSVALNLKREAEDRAEALDSKVTELEARIIELNQLYQNEQLQNNQNIETHLQLSHLQKVNEDLQTRIEDLNQDLTISHKEFEFSKIEQEQLKQVIQNQLQRISALEHLDKQKNQQIADLQQIEIELSEQLENIKVNLYSRTNSQKSVEPQMDNRLLLIDENTNLRHELKDQQKQIQQLQQQIQTLESIHEAKREEITQNLQAQNQQLQKKLADLTKQLTGDQAQIQHLQNELSTALKQLQTEQQNHMDQSHSHKQLIEQSQSELQRLSLELNTHTQSNQDLTLQLQRYKEQELEILRKAEQEYGAEAGQLQNKVHTLTQNLATKDFEHNLKCKEVEKLKQKIKEQEEYINDMENMAIEAHTEHANEVETLELKIQELLEGQPGGTDAGQDHSHLQQELQAVKSQIAERDAHVENLKNDKVQLQNLIRAMKGNLKQLRSVFIKQIQNGVSVQKKYLNMCRSQENINWDDTQLLSPFQKPAESEEDTLKTSQSLEVTQEFKTFEAEKELVHNAVIEITTGQNEINKGLQDQYLSLQEKLKVKQAKIDELVGQLKQTGTAHSLEQEKLEKKLAESFEQIQKMKADHQKQVEQITMQLITERQAAQEEMVRSGSQKSLKSSDSKQNLKDYETKIKKLEYQAKQHEQNMDSFQKVLSEETLKRQASENQILQKEEDNKELIEDIKQLTETLEAKDDELMRNYQQYQKDLKGKDSEIEGLKQNIQELLKEMSMMGSSAGESNQQFEKLNMEIQALKQQVSLLEHQNRNHISEFEAMQLEKEDIIFDKDIEIKQMQKQLNNKDQEILELQTRVDNLMQNPVNQFNDLEFLEHQSNAGFVQNKRHSMLSGGRQEFQFQNNPNQNDFRKSQYRESLMASPYRSGQQQTGPEELDLNIYGAEEQSDSSENDQVFELAAGYNSQNRLINNDITRDSGDSFSVKRVQTLNQNKLQQSMKQLEMVPSSASLLNKNVLESKIYQDLEAHTKKLQVDLEELSAINRGLLQQIEKITAEKNAAISDTVSVVSVQEELKSTAAQLASRKEEVKKLKDKMKLLESEKETKDMMIKQFNIEMENYAEEKLMYEEKIAILEETVTQLTGQLSVVIDDGNQKTINARKEELRKQKEEEERLKPRQLPSFLMPPPDAVSKGSDQGSKSGQKPRRSQNKQLIVDDDVRSDNSKGLKLQTKQTQRKKPTMAMF